MGKILQKKKKFISKEKKLIIVESKIKKNSSWSKVLLLIVNQIK
jgi:hypothetical protein